MAVPKGRGQWQAPPATAGIAAGVAAGAGMTAGTKRVIKVVGTVVIGAAVLVQASRAMAGAAVVEAARAMAGVAGNPQRLAPTLTSPPTPHLVSRVGTNTQCQPQGGYLGGLPNGWELASASAAAVSFPDATKSHTLIRPSSLVRTLREGGSGSTWGRA